MTPPMYMNAYCAMNILIIGWHFGRIITDASGVAAPNTKAYLHSEWLQNEN